jgi:hypothetical protein
VVVLGSFLCEDGDLHVAGPSSSGRSGVFRKAPPVDVTLHLCMEFTGSGGIRLCAPMFLFRPFWSGGSGAELYSLLPSSDILIHGEDKEAKNIIKVWLEDYQWSFESL